jgi:hypothetical protein
MGVLSGPTKSLKLLATYTHNIYEESPKSFGGG